jgi:hypothetical protein
MKTEQVGSPWLRQLYALYAPVREAAVGLTEEEINKAIDEALKEVRSRKIGQPED